MPSWAEIEFLERWSQSPTLAQHQLETEYRFCNTRRWRFDFALPNLKIAIEIEGATWTNGRHTRGSGYAKDLEKYNFAALFGWRVFRFTPDMIKRNWKEVESFLEQAVVSSAQSSS